MGLVDITADKVPVSPVPALDTDRVSVWDTESFSVIGGDEANALLCISHVAVQPSTQVTVEDRAVFLRVQAKQKRILRCVCPERKCLICFKFVVLDGLEDGFQVLPEVVCVQGVIVFRPCLGIPLPIGL